MPAASTVHLWVTGGSGAPRQFSEQYAQARESGLLTWADEILEIADDSAELESGPAVQAARLRVDSRKWLLSKLMPKQFGDRLGIEGPGGEAVQINVISAITRTPGDPKP
jgi:hypothetical protein